MSLSPRRMRASAVSYSSYLRKRRMTAPVQWGMVLAPVQWRMMMMRHQGASASAMGVMVPQILLQNLVDSFLTLTLLVLSELVGPELSRRFFVRLKQASGLAMYTVPECFRCLRSLGGPGVQLSLWPKTLGELNGSRRRRAFAKSAFAT